MKEKIVLSACVESIPRAVEFVTEYLKSNDINSFPDKIGIVVDEIFSNIANYAYDGKEKNGEIRNVTVSCSYASSSKEFTIKFVDSGKEYNPLTTPEPDINLPLEKRKIGGLGVFIVKKFMDKLFYKREGNKNILVLKKKF